VSGRREIAIGLGAYAAYLAVRQVVWTDAGRARAGRNARRLIDVERRLGLFVEPRVQALALRAPRVVDALNAGYAAGNVALSVGWLIRLFARDDPAFRRERRAAIIAFLAALPVFLIYPTAPPRTQDGFIDTLADRGIDLGHPVLVRLYNPIAAMPSHHVAFALVTGEGLARRAGSRWVRAAWRGYAPLVAIVVVATGNHFVVDVVAGAGLGVLARRLAR
jgi:membrane-associated phospholipid phosphatase